MQTPLIEASRLGVEFGDRVVLRDIDLTVRPGEVVTLIGPNGGGKTTLLRCLLGLQPHQHGRITRRPELQIGYVPQRFQLDAAMPMTVRRLMQLTRKRDPGRVQDALGQTGMGGSLDNAVHTLSGGELQRVLLARALLGDPNLLVLDEPLQGVDPGGEASLYKLIGSLRRARGFGVLVASHDLHLVMAETDWVLCLNGHVCCAGQPAQVSSDPAYQALFGRAAAELAVYRHQHDHSHAPDGRVMTQAKPPTDAG